MQMVFFSHHVNAVSNFRRRHTTISDLAKQLKLSPSTVSRALRDHPDISNETKERVMDMASKTNYQPNLIAQSLQNRRSNTIGVVVPEIRNTFFSTVISGIEEVAYEAGYIIMVCQSADRYQREKLNIQALVANRVAGMLVSISQETRDYSHLQMVKQQGVPLVLFDRVIEGFDASCVVVDDFGGAYKAVEHLIASGRKRIAFIGGSGDMYISRKRCEGYEAAILEHGLKVLPDYIIACGHHEEDGRNGAQKLFSLSEPPDAIFAVNDPVAIGAFVYCEEHEVKIPDDVAVVGFSNNPNTTLIRPRLTTVDQPAFEIGRRAAKLLLQSFESSENDENNEMIVLPTELIIRESS